MKKGDKLLDIKIPLECPACGEKVPASAKVTVEAPEGWEFTEFLFKAGIKAHGRHDDCPRINVAGAISAELGTPDKSYITEGGSRVHIWKDPKEKESEDES